MLDDALLKDQLAHTLEGTNFEGLGERYEGKVRDNYSRGDRRFIVVTDRISAFDRILGTIPFKGQVLNRLAAWWFERTKDVAKSHFIKLADPNVLECIECKPLPVELVVRAYITGSTSTSMWTHYNEGTRSFCGHELPEGLVKNQRLERPLLTPATKAPMGQHDVSASREEILERGGIDAKDFDRAAEMAMALFAAGQKVCAERGLILVDTKYEMGKTPDGEVVVIDEWGDAASFQKFFESNTKIPELLQAANVQGPPEVQVFEPMETADQF
jgi:phosphoribosylaminoimidazole-succinocarboxamide synthase